MSTTSSTKRPDWDQYFADMASQVATRATCSRKHVGCVIVRDKTVLATGYNGSIKGRPHCDEIGHLMEDGHCIRTVHAEANAVAQAARNGTRLEGASAYVTASPCWKCFQLLCNTGIKRIIFREFYRDSKIMEEAIQAGVELVDLSEGYGA